MGTAFRRSRGGTVTATFYTGELDLLRSLVLQLMEIIDDGSDPVDTTDPLAVLTMESPRDRPSDPVLARLFPDAYGRDDADSAADFRRYTERGLRTTKAANAQVVLDSLEAAQGAGRAGSAADLSDLDAVREDKAKVVLPREAAGSWLRTLTDLRLALGTRLGVEEDDEQRWAALADDDPRRYVHDVYHWLGFVQETLVAAVSGRR